jgi:hypothetical protein
MSVIGSNILAGASGQGGGYNLTKSLRFRSSASAYLNRTPASNGNQKTFTISFWVKRGKLGDAQAFVGTRPDGNNAFKFSFDSNDKLNFDIYISYQSTALVSTQVFRDPSAWYHIVAAFDSTQATASNRVKIYVNGSQITAWSTATYPSLNDSAPYNSTVVHNIGRYPYPDSYLDGYLTEFNNIDGQALTPSSFGETSATTGVWQPKKYAGTYGTNGFYLPFTDNSALTTSSNVGLGKDFSGNGNYWTTNNISITSGSTYDSMTDVPTLTNATAANYCTLNPLAFQSAAPSGGNLNGDGTNNCTATIACPSSGKYYFEMTMTNGGASGQIGIFATTCPITSLTAGTMLYTTEGRLYENDVLITSSWATFTNGDTVAVAVNMDAGEISFYKNNTLQGTRSFVSQITNSSPVFAVRLNSGVTASANFGQRPFTYTPPTGFVALNTFNLPTPTIGATASTQAGKYFNPILWTGNGASTIDVTGVGFQPDFVWAKRRSAADGHGLFDVVRGTGGNFGLLAFNPDGFQMGSGSAVNLSGATYVAWNWKANGTGVTNTAGSITSTVSANTSSGFSVVTYTGNGTSGATVGHGLGIAPTWIIIKNRAISCEWMVGTSYTNTSTPWGYPLHLNLTNARGGSTDAAKFNNTAPSSTVFTLGNGSETNGSGNNIVAYCFSEVAGYSKFGSYTGNDNPNGTFVYTGFRPRYVMIKASNAAVGWVIYDSAINPTNEASNFLVANSSTAQLGSTPIDFVSNGFKLRNNDGSSNGANNYIYMAFAENPMKYSLAR